MKKNTILFLSLGILFLIGCSSETDISDRNDVIENKENINLEISELKQKIQNLNLYEPLTEEDINRLSDCEKNILGPIENIKKLNLYKSEKYNLTILAIPGLQDLSKGEFNNLYTDKHCDGLGKQIHLLPLTGHLLTRNPISCGLLWGNETEYSKECAKIHDKLTQIERKAIEERSNKY